MSTNSLPAVMNGGSSPALTPSLSGGVLAIEQAMEGLKAIRTFVKAELKPGLDYGKIPGTGEKPTLLLPGAQKATMYFNAWPRHTIDRVELGDGHLEVMVTTHLVNRATERVIAEGVGSCSTLEKKYRYRNGGRICPSCGGEFIIKGREEYGGGFICFAKKGGCGAKYQDGDPAIESQHVGQIPNPDIHDVRNTVLKMAKKRADVDAAMSLGCLSELFTQDLEDTYDLPVRVSPWDEPERTQTAHGEAPAAKPSGKPPTIGKGKAKDERTAFEVVRDGCDAIARDFRSEFPDGLWDLSNQQVERHLLKFATNKSTEGMSNEQVRAALFDAYEGPKHNAIRKELKTYLEGKFTAARKAAVGAAIDNAGQASTEASETDDDSDPEMSIDERAPDGHQIGD